MRAIQSAILLALFLLFMTVIAVMSESNAANRPGWFSSGTLWGDGSETDYTTPAYIYRPYDAHNQGLLHKDNWHPENWVKGNANFIQDRFYKSGLVTDQYVKNDIMILEVSDLFVRLSDIDKVKVLKTVDYMQGITKNYPKGFYKVRHKRTGRIIALYSGGNVQLL